MSAPQVISTFPLHEDTDIPLGISVKITFDQLIDISTISEGTFSLYGPGQVGLISPDQLVARDPSPIEGREYLEGSFFFATNPSSQTEVTFTPNRPLRPGTLYTVLLVGSSSLLSTEVVKNTLDEPMVQSYLFVFTTGSLDVTVPPPVSPLPSQLTRIDPSAIMVRPRENVGADLTQVIELIFPDEIDPGFDPTTVLVGVEAILRDSDVQVPSGLSASVQIDPSDGKKLLVTISGWPN